MAVEPASVVRVLILGKDGRTSEADAEMPDLKEMLTPEVLDGMERWMKGSEPPMTLPQAVNAALGDWLTGQGCLKYVENPEGEPDPDA